jgi:chromosome segregation ATPase
MQETIPMNELEQLRREHRALMHEYGRAQARCSELLQAQARELARLRAQNMRLRASAIALQSALAWAGEDRKAVEQAIPELPERLALARQVDTLAARVESLMRERLRWQDSAEAAELVICQTGCLSHGDYWRVHDHCRRTGKTCVLVTVPDRSHV